MNQVFMGVLLHALGGFASASFYLPYKRVKGWAWESYWLVGGLFSWLAAPIIMALLTVPDLMNLFANMPLQTLVWPFVWGGLWGLGGLTFGLSMRYLYLQNFAHWGQSALMCIGRGKLVFAVFLLRHGR